MSDRNRNYYDHTDPTTALQRSQKANAILSKSSLSPSSLPLSIISTAETPEDWVELEQTFYACLRAEDDELARRCLERLSQRFGAENERIVAMHGLFQEAVAKDDNELRTILQEYNKTLESNPMNIPVHKRRIALIRSLGKPQEAIISLVRFLESFPTDTEAWCELSDLYQSQGLSAQAIYSLEEALLTVPNAWNLQARLGELNVVAAKSSQESTESTARYLVEATQRFARSVELCDDYLRGYYGLKLATGTLLKLGSLSKLGLNVSESQIRRLHDLSTGRLKSIVQQASSKSTKFNNSEVIAAHALLDGK